MVVKKIIFLLILSFVAGCATNPITGKQELMLFGQQQDIQIGKSYAPEIEKELGGRILNATLQSYINNVGQKIVAVSYQRQFNYQFTALNVETTNAFALPGGYVFITKGMLLKLQTEAQLAAILAHEVTHVVVRDTTNAMSNQIGLNILISAATTEKTPQTASAVINITRQIIDLKYSRSDEKTADLGGLQYMYKAGYNPYAMVETMEILQQESDSRPIEFLSTHPSPENRAGYISDAIKGAFFNYATLKTGKQEYQQNVLNQLSR